MDRAIITLIPSGIFVSQWSVSIKQTPLIKNAVILVSWQAAPTQSFFYYHVLAPTTCSSSEQTRPSVKAVHLQAREANGKKMLLE